jgi:hypothetical protein
MKTLIMLTAVTVFSVTMTSIAFAGAEGTPGQGFEHSLNSNTCFNAGAGNGGEFGSSCPPIEVFRERDPGQSGSHNQAPETCDPRACEAK